MNTTEYAPGMRTIIRDEEWMNKKITTNNMGTKTLHCVGISTLVKDKEAIFLSDLEEIKIVDPAEIKLVPDNPQSSGIEINDKYTGALKNLWDELISKQRSGNINEILNLLNQYAAGKKE